MSKLILNPQSRIVKPGDLVYHLLYGREWLGFLIRCVMDHKDKMALVHMVPGTAHEYHFRKSLTKFRISDKMGYLSSRWLRKHIIETN